MFILLDYCKSSARHVDTSRTGRSIVRPRPGLLCGSSFGSSSDNGISLLLQSCSIANRTVGAGRARNSPDLLENCAGSQEGSRASRMGSVVGKERVPIGASPPSLTGRGNLGWLGHEGHRVVRLGQLVLDSVVGAECVVRCRAAVVSVAVPLAPSLEEDRQRTDVRLLHRLDEGQDVGEDVVVDVLGAKAGPLTLVLQHHGVP